MRQLGLRLAAAGLALCGATASWSQQVSLEPSDALRCLTPAADVRGVPEYPFFEFKTQKAGRVTVELSFDTPDTKPKVTVLSKEGGEAFVAAVEDHVKAWRVPCHNRSETPARLSFEFVFRREDGKVHQTEAEDTAAQRQMLKCVKHLNDAKLPRYPARALREEVQGRVVAELRFEGPDLAPQVKMHGRPSALKAFGSTITEWVAELRMPCHTGEPVNTTYLFLYRFDEGAYGFKPGITFLQLLRLMRAEDRQRMPPDTTTMVCPFDAGLQYRQPDLPNRAWQLGTPEPLRRPFLEWLKTVQFNVPASALDLIYGDSVEFQVPCIKIRPNPNPGVTQ